MNSLELYFLGEYKQDFEEIEQVASLIQKCIPVFFRSHRCDSASHSIVGWPYEFDSKGPGVLEKKSHSTHAMILSMLIYAANAFGTNSLYPELGYSFFRDEIKPSTLKSFVSDVENDLSSKVAVFCKAVVDDVRWDNVTSSSYGKQDPFTLLWCYCVSCSSLPFDLSDARLVKAHIDKYVERLALKLETDRGLKLDLEAQDSDFHSFVMLRFLHLFLACSGDYFPDWKKVFGDYFEKKMHLQLSYFDIPDSRFDPAELAFSLEGFVLSSSGKFASEEVVNRAFEVFSKSQETSPHWRPVNPVYAQKTGHIFLPLSVEVARSLLRTCSVLGSDPKRETLFSRHSGVFRRYFRWLKAQCIECVFGGVSYYGWTSEHVGRSKVIHLWQSSEIMAFLIGYHDLLKKRVAAQSLVASGLKVSYDYVLPKGSEQANAVARWDSLAAKYEPFQSGAIGERIFDVIKAKFIEPIVGRERGKALYSILLYGPPGTGKTTVAESMAESLGWKLIVVTPSDFLAGGAGEVEARAKAIFECLEKQTDAVILFDEIDHFLLDRSSDEYRNQTGIFQFMTPGMLPKFNSLRKKSKSIFVIATNYEERIDPAIKRVGRIDVKLPLMPPDLVGRTRIIAKILHDSAVEDFHNFAELLAQKTALCTYGDLSSSRDNIVAAAKSISAANEVQHAVDSLDIRPTISLASYRERFFEMSEGEKKLKGVANTPIVEYAMLMAMKGEVYSRDFRATDVGPVRFDGHVFTDSTTLDGDYAAVFANLNISFG